MAHTARGDDNNNKNNNTHLFSLLSVDKFKTFFLNLLYKHIVNASSCTVELWMHLWDVLEGQPVPRRCFIFLLVLLENIGVG